MLTDPANGIVKFGSTNVRATATYVCNKGFVLVGSAVRVCQQDGEWSGEEPICRGGLVSVGGACVHSIMPRFV